MSNIYIQEPPSNGKVLLKTTLGDIDIELWSKEAPKACRNFVQLCLENYYDNVIFHRVVKGFIAQGGDPTGTGTGGESVYGKPFKDEFHQRLKFNRRGLVAMANAGKDDNGSQFFFTLDRTEELNKKHTIFGKVAGHTIYNMVRFNDLEVDEDDRPISPPKILRTEVLYNPFDDIVPRKTKSTVDKNETEKNKIKSKSKATKNFTLLSFGEEAEEDEVENDHLIQEHKVKSSHDVLDDPRLSSQTVEEAVVENPSQKKTLEEDNIHAIRKKLKNEDKKSNQSKERKDIDDTTIEKKKLSKEKSEKLIKNNAKKEKTENSIEEDNKAKNELMEELVQQRKEYLKEKKDKKILKKERGGDREKMTLKLLAGFQNQLDSFKDEEQAESKTEKQWMSHQLNFEDGEESAKDANMKSDDWYDIYDPRNPVNKRRRDASKGESKKKKR